MLAPGCQSVSSRTKLFHSGPSITTMTGLVMVKAKDLALLGSNCQLPPVPPFLQDWTAIVEQLWGFLRNFIKWKSLHIILATSLILRFFWQLDNNTDWKPCTELMLWTSQLSPPLYQSVSAFIHSIPTIFLVRPQHTWGVLLLPRSSVCTTYNNSEHFWPPCC